VKVSFLVSELAKWDLLDGGGAPEALILPFFSDERPLHGAAGLCDWRLCGRLSRMLLKKRVVGELGETVLYPPVIGGRLRLPFPRLLLFGLGAGEGFDEARARDAGRKIQEMIGRLGLPRYALVPPGRSTGRLSARRALEIYLEELGKQPIVDGAPATELVVVESAAGQKEAADLTRR
jgi:hypothetical protein